MKFLGVEKAQYQYLTQVLGVESILLPKEIDLDKSLDSKAEAFNSSTELELHSKFILVVEENLSMEQQTLLAKMLTALKWPSEDLRFIGEPVPELVSKIGKDCFVLSFGRKSLPQFTQYGLQSYNNNHVLIAEDFHVYSSSSDKKKQLWEWMQAFMEFFPRSMS